MDSILIGYSRLTALRDNIKESHPNSSIEEEYVNEYNTIVAVLSKEAGLDLSDFIISQEHVRPHQLTQRAFSKKSYCQKVFFLSKLEAILMYFSIKNSGQKVEMGYSTTK